MTGPQQRRLFFPAWTETCRRLGWSEESGRLVLRHPEGKNERQARVIAAAGERARQEFRAPTVDDLRHGCYIVALGRDRDTMKLGNREINDLLDFFKLLVDETNIGADMRRSNPQNYDREALVVHINRMNIPFAMIDEVCKRSFAPVYTHPYYEDMPLPELRGLVGVLEEIKNRKSEIGNLKPKPEPAPAGEIPF